MFSKNNTFCFAAPFDKGEFVKFIRSWDGGSVDKMEHALLKMVSDDIIVGAALPEIRLTDPNARWRVVSALQKAIRRGDASFAIRAASALDNADTKYLWRRLMVIALEDGGIPMLPIAALIGYLGGKEQYRKQLGSGALLGYVVEQMCLSLKDRSFCETSNASKWTSPESLKVWLFKKTVKSSERIKRIEDPATKDTHRFLCARALSGGLKHTADGDGGSQYNEYAPSDRPLLLEWVDNGSLPLLCKYVIRRGISLGAEGLSVAVPFAWPAFEGTKASQIKIRDISNALPEAPYIGKLPSVSLDMHTVEGKKAIAYFMKACEPVEKWFHDNPINGDKLKFTGLAFFYTEGGGVLDRALLFPYSTDMLELALDGLAKIYRIERKQVNQFHKLAIKHLPQLNEARRRVTGN